MGVAIWRVHWSNHKGNRSPPYRGDKGTPVPREVNWFRQNLAIAIQRGNALSLNAELAKFPEIAGTEFRSLSDHKSSF